MNSPAKISLPNHERKTKAQLQQELDKAYDTLKKQEVELATLRNEFKKEQSKSKELEATIESNHEELEPAPIKVDRDVIESPEQPVKMNVALQ